MFAIPFHFPNLLGNQFVVGLQPFDPGVPSGGGNGLGGFYPMPWPGAVDVINLNIGFGGIARNRAPVPVVDNYSPLLYNQLFIAGFAGKSQG